jgi:hypothetical protein
MRIAVTIVITLMSSLAALAHPLAASAQTADTAKPTAKSETTTKPKADDKAAQKKMDLDSFFKDAEDQTRKAQESGNSNCVPKPDEAPTEPVT